MRRGSHLLRDDSGMAIVAVLVFMLLLGVVSVAVANYAFTTYKTSEATIEVSDEVSAQSEVLDESIAFLREATGGDAAKCANPSYTAPVVFAMQDVRKDKWLRVTCVYRGAAVSEDLAPDFSAVVVGDNGTGPFLELNGLYDAPFKGDVILKHPTPGPTIVCFEEYPDAGCETASSGGRAGRMVLTQGVLRSVAPGPPAALDLPPKIVKRVGTEFQPVDWIDQPPPVDPDPHWQAPDTTSLGPGGYVLSGCRNEGFDWVRLKIRYSCIRTYSPGTYSSNPNFKIAQPSGTMDNNHGTCADSTKFCVIRANWLQPGVYKMNALLRVTKSNIDAPVIGGTLADAVDPQAVPAAQRCIQGSPGVAIVFGPQYGIHHYDSLLSIPTADITLCHVRPEQLLNSSGAVQGQPGLAVYQEPDGLPANWGEFAILSSECILGANGALVIHGMVYVPEGNVFVCTGHSANPIKVGTGVVAWKLKIAAYDLADYNLPLFGPSESGAESDRGVAYDRTLDLTVDTCAGMPTPPVYADCTVESSVTAQLKIGYDTDATAWISRYLPGGE
ncbi:MAG: hypothetical protein DYH08_02315 [Actinobacteria bacterium ATB1]|nr:hypothetical protein [Actinobacteria bacterium ATB1]